MDVNCCFVLRLNLISACFSVRFLIKLLGKHDERPLKAGKCIL